MPQTAINSVVAGTRFLFNDLLSEMKDRISKKIQESVENSEALCSEIEKICDEMSKPFNGLETEWLQNSFAKKNFGIVVSTYNIEAFIFIKTVYTHTVISGFAGHDLAKINCRQFYETEGFESFNFLI